MSQLFDLATLLRENAYPGRGIVLGNSADGKSTVAAYFIMGRSENSRNRIFSKTGDGIRTEAFDSAKMEDPSLIIYHPVRESSQGLIVTNGDQTDTIAEFLKEGKTFEDALRTRCFEPDGPNWTARISGLLAADGAYRMAILKSADAQGQFCTRHFFDYPARAGIGHFLHTYKCDGNPIPTFEGEPEMVALPNTAEELTALLWDNLNEANKISLYVCYTDRATDKREVCILNKNK